MSIKLRIADIIRNSLLDGPGVRTVVFFQGCPFHCKGCHNPESWDFNGGREITVDDVFKKITPITTGITLSGGEPSCQFEASLAILLEARKRGLSTMLYTGRNFKQWQDVPNHRVLAGLCDYIKIGPFIQEQMTLGKPYCGSNNQTVYRIEDEGMTYCALKPMWQLRYRKDYTSEGSFGEIKLTPDKQLH